MRHAERPGNPTARSGALAYDAGGRAMSLRPKQQKLLAALRAIEQSGARMLRHDLAAHLVRETGYKEVTTYLSKYLEPVIVKAADDLLEVRGVIAMSEEDFASLLTQKRLAAETQVALPRYETREEWVEVVRDLLEYGANREFLLDMEDIVLVASVLPTTKPSR